MMSETSTKTTCIAQRYPGDTGVVLSDAAWDDVLILDGAKYHRHSNGGGWVAETASVAADAFVGLYADVEKTKPTMIVDIFGLHFWTRVRFSPSPPKQREIRSERSKTAWSQRSEGGFLKICEMQ